MIEVIQRIIILIVVILCTYYINLLIADKFSRSNLVTKEGFQGTMVASDAGPADVYTWMNSEQLYDGFYAQIYDQLAGHGNRITLQVAECLGRWKMPRESMRLLDIGCGTGTVARTFASNKIHVCALDNSPPMLEQAKKNLITSNMKTADAALIELREGDMNVATTCKPAEFTHTTLFYFSVYYCKDKLGLFKNIYSWTEPGGHMMVEVVNKYKFDPMLNAAAPFVGFSLQKYAPGKERLNKSKITFNGFDYEADFLLLEEGDGSEAAEFREVFHFKQGGTVRRQKHTFWMPEIKDLIRIADQAGWTYRGFKDMLPMGFEYSYMLFFERD